MKRTKSTEDYLEAIYVLSQSKKPVRVKDVAEFLSVKPPSVTELIKNLVVGGYVIHTPYGGITLTKKGKKIGKAIWEKHKLIFTFLNKILGVSEEEAFKEACLIEHCISDETKERIKNFLNKNKKGG